MALSTEMILTLQQLKGVGNKTIIKVAKNVEVPISTLEQLLRLLRSIPNKKVQSITEEDLETANGKAWNIMLDCKREGVGIISFYDEVFPETLRTCIDEDGKSDPPILLYYRGNIDALQKPGIAVIGTREPTKNGIFAGKYFSSEFAKRGYNIVSGLAIGCDTSGHQGALEAGGVTTAFLANGLDWESIYPKENLELAKNIVVNGGLLLSEYPLGQTCGRFGLVARDRLQAGLSYATVVVQTGEKGGTMHAVNATIKSGKPLFAVEYKRAEDTASEKTQGNIKLIKEKKAYSLSSDTIEDVICIIQEIQSRNLF